MSAYCCIVRDAPRACSAVLKPRRWFPPAARAPQLRGPGPRPACRKESSLPAERRRLIFLELVSSPMTDEEFRAELYTKGREILERLGSARFGAGLPPIERQDVKQ
jgi:hypothetical protein